MFQNAVGNAAPAVIKRLDRIFATCGLPKEIFSDNCPPFTSREIKQFMKDRGITLRHVTLLWLQANGKAEASMKPLAKAVKAAKLEGKTGQRNCMIFF